MKNIKIYGGIYTTGPSKKTDQFIMDETMTALENKLAPYYIWETIAHNLMTAKCGIVPIKSAKKIVKGLLSLLDKSKTKQLVDPSIGDVHENVERLLADLIGEDAGWFHVARSRNDQTVTDQKLFTKKYVLDIFEELNKLEHTLWNNAELYKTIVMPGFTHLRSAMPSSFGFWWQAYLIQILDSHTILKHIFEVYDTCPLGAGASYGVNWKIDPNSTALKLGFIKPFNNALCAINNRGIEDAHFISQLAIFLTVLSRMMEDLIIWSMPEINFVAISEEFTTGSSIMPQKMNPDIAEKIKSKSSKMIANLNHVLIAMKGTPSGYNHDSAESKIAIMASLEEALNTISIANDLLEKVAPHPEIMKKSVVSSLPTKLADELVKKLQIPFRTAHKIVGKTVNLVQGDIGKINNHTVECAIKEITEKEIVIDKELTDDVFNVNNALKQYQYEGAASPKYIHKVNKKLKKELIFLIDWSQNQRNKFSKVEQNVCEEIANFISS